MIPHNRPTLGKEEEEAAIRVIRSGNLSQGNEVKLFEDEFCKFIGLPKHHAVALSSGTSSLFLALRALNAQDKTVELSGYACSALRNAIQMAGGNEKILDVGISTPNTNSTSFSENDAIRIIIHMYGIPIDISQLSTKSLIEDCAQSLGAKIGTKFVGTIAEAGIFSFSATKLITTGGQGGMFISKNESLVNSVKDYREFDLRHDKKSRFNLQMTDLQASIGREQLKKLPSFLLRREEIFKKYKKSGIPLLDVDIEKTHLHPVRYRAVMLSDTPLDIIQSLSKFNIKSIVPTEDWELLAEPNSLPNSLYLSKHSVSLPIYPSLSNDDIDSIISVVVKK